MRQTQKNGIKEGKVKGESDEILPWLYGTEWDFLICEKFLLIFCVLVH